MALFFAVGSPETELSEAQIREGLYTALRHLDASRERRRVLAVPPDFTRMHSQSGVLTEYGERVLSASRLVDVLTSAGHA